MTMKIPNTWTFKTKEVAGHFDSHVREQLPWYELCTSMATYLARSYLSESGTFLDLGCSTGNMTSSMKEYINDQGIKCISVDNSPEMEKLFTGVGKFVLDDISRYELPKFDVCMCFLSLMFVPIDRRSVLIRRLTDRCNKGGAIIIVDKIVAGNGYLGTVINRVAMSNKVVTGCDPKEIIEKEISLSGVQRPMSEGDFEGFTKWFQIGDFAGYIKEV